MIERLWKWCFYGRINELRVRLNKEKSRAKKRGGGSVSSGTNVADEIDKQLQQFLREAIALYLYLIKKYGDHLKESSVSQSQDEEYIDATISSLYRMHIHLGDLYRYSSNIQKAEDAYGKSAKLAPGNGNPFNQLAVVAQSQESQTVLALYYYARSLMANSLFETSRQNLVRLFEGNAKWLSEHGRNQEHKSLVGVKKKAQKDWLNKQKVVMTRTVMARLVELQFVFFRGISLEEDNDNMDLRKLMDMMEKQLEGFDELLSSAGCSEGLLCKIVAVLAFSSLGTGNSGRLSTGAESSLTQMNIVNNQAIAFSFLLRFVAVLANHTKNNIIEKEMAGAKVKVGNIRPLSSLLLGVKFAASLYMGSKWFHGLPLYPVQPCDDQCASTIRDLCKESHYKFWQAVADVANWFSALRIVWMDGPSPPECNDIRDFDDFHYYVPFDSFLNRASNGKSKYASLEKATAALASNASSTSKADEEEATTKIRLFLAAASKATRPNSTEETGSYFLEKDVDSNTLKALHENGNSEESIVENMILDNADNNFDVGETESKSQYSDLGVTLLTPAALLANVSPPLFQSPEIKEVTKVDLAPNVFPGLTSSQPKKSAQVLPPPPPGLPPPPGFGGTPLNANPSLVDPFMSLLPQQQQPLVQSSTYESNPNQIEALNVEYQSIANQVMSQAGLNLFDTINPFATTSSTEPLTDGINLNFMLNERLNKQSSISNNQARVDSIESDPYSHGDSLLNFLFETSSTDD